MDNLTPTINDQQLRENIDALQKQGVTNDKVQSYVDNYQSDGQGSYVLKTHASKPEDTSFMGNLKNRAAAVVEHPIEAAKGAIKNVGQQVADAAGTVQDLGQGVLGGIESLATGKNMGDTSAFKPGVGVDSLKAETPEGQQVAAHLTPTNDAQKGGSNLMTGAELYYGGGKQVLGEGANLIKKGLTATKEIPLVNTTYQALKDTAQSLKDKVMSTGLSKTPEEILATPESQAHTLSQTERDYYKAAQKENLAKQFTEQGDMSEKEFAAKQAQLEAEHNAITSRVNTQLVSDTAKSEKEIADLSKQVDETAYNKTLELKPKAVQALSNQSKTYRNLIEEDLAPHKDVPIEHSEISQKIDELFPENPAVAESMKSKLGLQKEGSDVIPGKKGQLPTIDSTPGNPPTSTVGDIYQKIKNLKGDKSKAGIRGGRVYTADDMNIDKVTGALSDILKEKGVDLSRANDFWRQWAPLRDKIVTKLKPFDTAGMETKTFSDILKSSGEDIHNQNFIKSFEKVLGEPITGETQAALSRLSTAEKAKVASEVDAKNALDEAKLAKKYGMSQIEGEKTASKSALMSAKDKAEQALREKQFQIDRLAARRKNIKSALKTGLGAAGVYEGNKILKETTGLGF